MDIDTLRRNLAIGPDGTVAITDQTVTTARYKSFFDTVFGGTPLTLSHARKGPGDAGDTVQVTGTGSSFQNVDGAPVIATFVLDPDSGDVTADIAFTLAGGGRSWGFRDSYPDLPAAFNFATTLTATQISPLYELTFSAAVFHATTDPLSVDIPVGGTSRKVDLEAGLAFAGATKLAGLISALTDEIGLDTEFALTGTIIQPTGRTLPRLSGSATNFPWVEADNPPGITLSAGLGIDFTLSDTLELTRTAFTVYSPLSASELQRNPDYLPAMGFSCHIYIDSLKVGLDLASKVQIGLPKLVITGTFENVTVGNLADFVGLAGTDTLIDGLPEPLRDAADRLGTLDLKEAAIAFSRAPGSGISADYVYLAVDMPEAPRWPRSDASFDFGPLTADFIVTTPFDGPRLSATMTMELDVLGAVIDVEAGYPDFFISGALKTGVDIPLQSFFHKYLPGGTTPPTGSGADLHIDALSINYDPGVRFNFFTEMAKDPSWAVPLGPKGLVIEDVRFGLSRTLGSRTLGTGPQTTAKVAGTLTVPDIATLSMSYDPTRGFEMRGAFADVTLNQLLGWITNADTVLPDGFGAIAFTESTLLIRDQSGTFELDFGTHVDHFGDLAFTLLDDSGTWGFALGLNLTLGQLASLDGLSAIKPFLEIFPPDSHQVIVISTIDKGDFSFPALSLFDNPKIGKGDIVPPAQSKGLRKGFYFYADASFGDNEILTNVARLMNLPTTQTLAISFFIGGDAATEADLSLTIGPGGVPADQNGLSLSGTMGIKWQGGEIMFYMTGTADTKIQGQAVQFDAQLLVTENGAFISGDMIVTGRGTINFSSFKLKELALELGISFEGVPSFGFIAALDFKQFDSSIAVFIDSADPAKSMVAGSVSDITLADIIQSIAGSTAGLPDFLENALKEIGVGGIHGFNADYATYAEALDAYDLTTIQAMFKTAGGISLPSDSAQIQLIVNTKGMLWYLFDLSTMYHYELQADTAKKTINVSLEAQLYVVPQNTQIATITFQEGYNVFGEIDFLIIQDTIQLEYVPQKGIAFYDQLNEIVVGGKNFLVIKAASDQTAPRITALRHQRAQAVKTGPRLLLCTFTDPSNPDPNFREPAMKISGEIDFLGITDSVLIEYRDEKFNMALSYENPLGTSYDIKAWFNGLQDMGASGSAVIGLDHPFGISGRGSFLLNDNVHASLGFGVSGDTISASASFGVTILGESLNTPSIHLDIDGQSLENIAQYAIKALEAALDSFFKDALRWLKALKNGLIEGFKDLEAAAKVLASYFEKTAKEAASLLHAAGYAAEEVLNVLKSVFEKTEEEAKAIVNFLYNVAAGCAMTTGLVTS